MMVTRKNYLFLGVVLITILFTFTQCKQESTYQTLVEKELQSGVKNDSLFLGIGFGMGQKDFFTHCWDLNKKQVLRSSSQGLSIQYNVDSALNGKPAFMYFYPDFFEKAIYKMPVEFSYAAWSPTNKELSSEQLLKEVLGLLETWYGGSFEKFVNEKPKQEVWIQVAGNRQIRVWIKDLRLVHVEFLDLLVHREMMKEN